MPGWVVLLEATNDPAEPLSAGQVRALQDALDVERSGGAICSGDRYALQVPAAGKGPVEALLDVVARWSAAARALALPPSRLIRTEVCTPEELARELEAADHERSGPDRAVRAGAADDGGVELLRRAFSDPLTGLLDRAAFVRQVEVTLTRTDTVAVVCVDLDGFRGPDRALCGATTDHLMRTLARRLGLLVRPGDVLGRLGADRFGVLLCGAEEAGLAAAHRLIAAARSPIDVPGRQVVVSPHAGVAVGRSGDSAAEVLRDAEAALCAARWSGDQPVLHGAQVPRGADPAETVATPALQDPLANLYLLQQAAVAANGADTLQHAVEIVLRQVANYAGADFSQAWVSPAPGDAASPDWRLVARGRRATREVADSELAGPVIGLTGRVFATGRPAWIPHLAGNGDGPVPDGATAGGLRSAFAFPVRLGEEVVAVLAFFARAHMEPSASFDDVVAGIASQLGRLVERQRAAAALRRFADELRASQALLSEAHFAGRLGSWHVDLRRAENNRTEGMHRLYGIDPGERLDMETMVAAVDPRDRDRAKSAMLRLVQTGEQTTEEVRIRRSDGQLRWHRAQGSAIRDETGDVVAIHGTLQDITEAKVAQEALLERERLHAEAQRTVGLGWWERDLVSGRLTWSEEMYHLWRWPASRPLSTAAVIATIQAEDRQTVLEGAANLRMTGKPFCVDFRVVRGDGERRWFRGGGHVVHNHAGQALKLFGTVQDISDQRRAAEGLRSSKLLYQRIVETTREGILTVDAGNMITFVNAQMGKLLGYEPAQLAGMAVTSLLGTELDALLSGDPARRRRHLRGHCQARLLAKDGTTVHVLVSISPLVDDNGEYAGALAMVSDVSAVREAEEFLRLQSARILAVRDDG